MSRFLVFCCILLLGMTFLPAETQAGWYPGKVVVKTTVGLGKRIVYRSTHPFGPRFRRRHSQCETVSSGQHCDCNCPDCNCN